MSPLRLSKPSVCPPDGFRYVFPEDGYTAHGWTYDAWVEEANKHCSANNYSIPDLEQKMQEQLCLTLPPGWCDYDDPNRRRPNPVIDWRDVLNATQTFARWMEGGMKFVSQAEAERRAMICSRCYLNVNVSGCSACHAIVQKIVGQVSTKYDFMLKACACCKCLLRAKVHFPMDVLDKELPGVQELYPEHCWLKQNGPNTLHVSD